MTWCGEGGCRCRRDSGHSTVGFKFVIPADRAWESRVQLILLRRHHIFEVTQYLSQLLTLGTFQKYIPAVLPYSPISFPTPPPLSCLPLPPSPLPASAPRSYTLAKQKKIGVKKRREKQKKDNHPSAIPNKKPQKKDKKKDLPNDRSEFDLV